MNTPPVRRFANPAGSMAVVPAVVAFALVLFASAAAALPLHFGVLGGIGFARLHGPDSPVVEFQGIKGAAYGLTGRFAVSPVFSVQPEVLVVTDGLSLGKFEYADDAGNPTGTSEWLHVLDRIQVPVLLRVAPPAPGRLRPFAFAGPYAALRLREYARITGAGERTITQESLAASDYGITLGGGMQAKAGPGQFEIQARYDAGLKDLGEYYGTGATRTGALRVLAGYSF